MKPGKSAACSREDGRFHSLGAGLKTAAGGQEEKDLYSKLQPILNLAVSLGFSLQPLKDLQVENKATIPHSRSCSPIKLDLLPEGLHSLAIE